MRAVDRTLALFKASVSEALPEARLTVSRSRNSAGHSRYVFIDIPTRRCWLKVRISDHAVGMRRARSGECDLFLSAGARPSSWAVWLSEQVKLYG